MLAVNGPSAFELRQTVVQHLAHVDTFDIGLGLHQFAPLPKAGRNFYSFDFVETTQLS